MRAAIGIFLLGLAVEVIAFYAGGTLQCGVMIDFKTVEETVRHLDACRPSRWGLKAGVILMASSPVWAVVLWLKSKL